MSHNRGRGKISNDCSKCNVSISVTSLLGHSAAEPNVDFCTPKLGKDRSNFDKRCSDAHFEQCHRV